MSGKLGARCGETLHPNEFSDIEDAFRSHRFTIFSLEKRVIGLQARPIERDFPGSVTYPNFMFILLLNLLLMCILFWL